MELRFSIFIVSNSQIPQSSDTSIPANEIQIERLFHQMFWLFVCGLVGHLKKSSALGLLFGDNFLDEPFGNLIKLWGKVALLTRARAERGEFDHLA